MGSRRDYFSLSHSLDIGLAGKARYLCFALKCDLGLRDGCVHAQMRWSSNRREWSLSRNRQGHFQCAQGQHVR